MGFWGHKLVALLRQWNQLFHSEPTIMFCVVWEDAYCRTITIGFFLKSSLHFRYLFFFLYCGSKITYCTTRAIQQHCFVGETRHFTFTQIAMVRVPMPILDCIILRQSRLAREKVVLNLFVSWKEHRNTSIGCNPFSGRLTHSTRQMREHKTVSPNYRRLSTSTIFDEKIWW